ncbi:chromosomal replication initiator protein DnaA [Candidatus Woesebacteria bacterium RIFCSPHIGHO2_01_FULL_44_10]|uniref:Chromosomal replication initiator protein DnaA n=1 Tax=Candidatus Woesebacteria bacterium RIFCSPLOWO2_01_FULL_44_14 TaxID=1802525 RepID=A0A1F8C128_9BACT|nr:MAG: chromosomal replication initiator protein DnaA [Candidatus Woesebacteria bacterium RIFCSPHIGHO2_01_FULL_44_10]OGM53715.1 MAG: chromosomal replication initiator protein DnaA [Candidatus Woesebacteria bacterium RIFCSPHIGHO2_12_FULL_44_11]OGM70061.1 MAG: chromosomal replication initiator protein DnaA [Candidatus Woesebacteria bacterium RIFCSPLOWO2_01_FULL_44_14]
MEKINKDDLWRDVLESIRVSVSSAIFSTWISQTHLASIRKTTKNRYLAEIGCISTFIKSTLETRYFGLIQDALIRTLDSPADLTFIVKQSPEAIKKTKEEATPLFDESANDDFLSKLTNTNLRAHLTFDNFAVSSTNQMAWAAAEAVATNPGTAYNPLFIWGGVGVGKTHLMNAVGIRSIQKGLEPVMFCTGEQFTNDIVQGIRNKTTQAFRNKYRRAKLLMVDDIQFIAGKDAVQDEFFHTFNAVTGAGGQVVMTSDQPPTEIAKLEERLRSRFEAGLTVDISKPDFELRCAITQIKAIQKGLAIESDIIQLIAGNIESARTIEGVLTRIMSETKIKGVPITPDLVQSILSKGTAEQNGESIKKANPIDVIDVVTKRFSVSKKDLLGKTRARIIARPRQLLMYILRTELELPLQEIGRMLARDHSTVIHAVHKISQLASHDVGIRNDILGIKNSL